MRGRDRRLRLPPWGAATVGPHSRQLAPFSQTACIALARLLRRCTHRVPVHSPRVKEPSRVPPWRRARSSTLACRTCPTTCWRASVSLRSGQRRKKRRTTGGGHGESSGGGSADPSAHHAVFHGICVCVSLILATDGGLSLHHSMSLHLCRRDLSVISRRFHSLVFSPLSGAFDDRCWSITAPGFPGPDEDM